LLRAVAAAREFFVDAGMGVEFRQIKRPLRRFEPAVLRGDLCLHRFEFRRASSVSSRK
jgi:hypothetical protein